jgi:hypothetical protein
MIVNMADGATEEQINHIIDRIREAGYQPHVTRGTERTIVAAVGSGRRHEIEALQVAPGVDNVVAIAQPFKLVSKQVKPQRSVVTVGGVPIGGEDVVVIAGPCSVESREQMISTAHAVKKAGASLLRGGAYKPRTSPYDFQGLGEEALKILREASGRGAQHAELRALTEAGNYPQAGVIEARAVGNREGVVAGRGVPAGGRKQGRGAVRAGHQDVRDRDAKHDGPGGGGAGPRPVAPAGDC